MAASLLIAEFENKLEAELVAKLIGTMRKARVLQKGNSLEDMYFAELITEGMKEKRNHSITAFKRKLNAQIKALKK